MSLWVATVLTHVHSNSVLWNGSSKGVSTSCCLSPHLFRLPVKLGNTLYMFPHLPHCSFNEVCTLHWSLPPSLFLQEKCSGYKKEKEKKKRKEKIHHFWLRLRVPVILYVFLLLSSLLNEMHIHKPVPHSPGLRFCWLYLAGCWLSWQRCLQELTQEISLKCAKKTCCAEGFPSPPLVTES